MVVELKNRSVSFDVSPATLINLLKGTYIFSLQRSQPTTLQSHLCSLRASAVTSKKIDGVATEPLHSCTHTVGPLSCNDLSCSFPPCSACLFLLLLRRLRLVQQASLLGGLKAAPAVQCGSERGQPQSPAVLPAAPGTPLCPQRVRGKRCSRVVSPADGRFWSPLLAICLQKKV